MGIVAKAGRFSPVKKEFVHKDDAAGILLQKLRAFLDKSEPDLVYILVNTWNTQGKAITYKEIREALLSGDLDLELLEEWMEDYSNFVTIYLRPAWHEAMEAATADLAAKYSEWRFDPFAYGAFTWTENRAAEFVTSVSSTQMQGLRAVIQRAAVLENLSVDQLARAIRPMVGLHSGQTIANLKYYNNLIESGVSERKALDLSIRYSARQHRYRAYNIARTELAMAYNHGSYEGTKQAQEAGYMGEVKKIWCTADDERVCSICGSLEGKAFGMDEEVYYEFEDRNGSTISRRINHKLNDDTVGKCPPAHPGCRCTLLYKEVSPPIPRINRNAIDRIDEIG